MFSSDDYNNARVELALNMQKLDKIYPNTITLLDTSTGRQMELKIDGREWFTLKNMLITMQKEKLAEIEKFVLGLTQQANCDIIGEIKNG